MEQAQRADPPTTTVGSVDLDGAVAGSGRIDNGHGEVIEFLGEEATPSGPSLLLRNEVQPGAGPPMHVHFRQDEELTVTEGRLAYQVLGEEVRTAGPGESVVFAAGVPHRFWSEGPGVLRCVGRITPPHDVETFLRELYRSSREHGRGGRPNDLDVAYLLHRYRDDVDLLGIPPLVKRLVFPLLRVVGTLSGRYRRFAGRTRSVG